LRIESFLQHFKIQKSFSWVYLYALKQTSAISQFVSGAGELERVRHGVEVKSFQFCRKYSPRLGTLQVYLKKVQSALQVGIVGVRIAAPGA